MNNENAITDLIKITNKNLGFQPRTPSDFNLVILAIKKKTGQEISMSSMKRLWGYVDYTSRPSPNILNILCRFNEFDDWDDYLRRYGTLGIDDCSEFIDDNQTESDNLTPDDILNLAWGKDKQCTLRYLGNHRFRVIRSQNIKLLPDDTFTMHSASIGLPFYAADIHRDKSVISGYIGAKNGGILSLSVKKTDK